MGKQTNKIIMSSFPTDDANWQWDDEWSESNKVCPKCNEVYMWQSGWYDDSPEMGGVKIGTMYTCGDCNFGYEI